MADNGDIAQEELSRQNRNNNAPFFSIIIPTYNRSEPLQRALSSIAEQTFQDFEVIVCDDGSTDNTEQVVKNFSTVFRVSYFWQENWGGPARPRNTGIKAAVGDWICFLDSDDWWYPDKLDTAKRYLEHHDIDVLYHDLDLFSTKGKHLFKKIKEKNYDIPVFVSLMKNGQGPANSSMVVRKSILDKVGGLSEDKSLVAVEDYDLWLRISRITDNFFHIHKTLGAYWHGGDNITEISDKQIERIHYVFRKYSNYLSQDERDEVFAVMCYITGRIKQQTGQLNSALKLYKNSLKSKNAIIKLKSILMIAYLRFLI